ncbi:UvrD-helicase domain-containing protein [Collinsella sp. An2]|uniref:UvrD-helicase domain-containing protein n=1 Tax=Collinsella sp. An2 TaxID=1965585 RepID=UPI001EF3E740|nr:UvrD-helicase domain-containing protein [Collinsella sp. An2]
MAIDLSTLMPQQLEIVKTLDGPLFVSAGAGSGKTFTLTQRILWALSPESGPYVDHLDQVLAITFTKDAAAEIRERVRAALVKAGVEEEALRVDDAWISTIHGMCSRILRAHALELGLDPEFSVLGDPDELMDQAVEHVLARMQAEGRLPFHGGIRDWFALRGEVRPGGGEGGTSVVGIVRRLLELSCALPHGMDDVHLARGYVDFSGLADACRAYLADANPKSKGAQKAQELLGRAEAIDASTATLDQVVELLMNLDVPAASGNAKAAATLIKAEAAEAVVNAYVALSSDALDELLLFARNVEAEYRRLKAEQSLLDNDDLLRLAFAALRDHESVRAAYEGKFKLVMIDEFQDTAQQQVDLIDLLAGEGGIHLCTVGDAQQSIYRFRGADVEVFRRKEREISRMSDAGADGIAGQDGAVSKDAAAGQDAAGHGHIVRLIKNFRSHADILDYVAQVFDDGRGGIMRDFLDLVPNEGRADGLKAQGASRRQAIFVAAQHTEDIRPALAASIARRFRELSDAGQPAGGMVLLLGGMTYADLYADAIRAEGLDCVIAGGSVFSQAPEVSAVRALACALANPADTAQGLALLLQSPMFSLGVQEFLALTTAWDSETGETRRRNLDAGIASSDDAPGLAGLELVGRARTVLRRAFSRVGRDPFARIARDVVNESGWFVRLADRGPEGKAVAANVLKALDALGEAEAELGNAPRKIVLAFDRFLAGKEAPGALNEEGGDAVRIMTVHASKGLEFPVVAVAECFSVRSDASRFRVRRESDRVDAALLPSRFPSITASDGSSISATAVEKQFKKVTKWLNDDLADEVCATGSALGAFNSFGEENLQLELAERARLLYVAMTRARELLILAMGERIGSEGKIPTLKFDERTDLTGRVLERILPAWPSLATNRLYYEGSQPGDFEFIPLSGFVFEDASYEAVEAATPEGEEPVGAPGAEDALPDDDGPMDTFTLVEPVRVSVRTAPSPRPPRISYSYTSMAAALHAEDEDRAVAADAGEFADALDAAGLGEGESVASLVASSDADEVAPAPPVVDVVDATFGDDADEGAGAEPVSTAQAAVPEDPTALGSAFHAAAQWLIETRQGTVPASRIASLCAYWGVSESQRARLLEALGRWERSAVRREVLSWPCVRAEVPFFSEGMDGARERFGSYAEGSIDVLCTDPARPDEAFVVDYKTGGSASEMPEKLRDKHELQARVYADALHRAGFARVTLTFVRVQIEDPSCPGEPQTVTYQF